MRTDKGDGRTYTDAVQAIRDILYLSVPPLVSQLDLKAAVDEFSELLADVYARTWEPGEYPFTDWCRLNVQYQSVERIEEESLDDKLLVWPGHRDAKEIALQLAGEYSFTRLTQLDMLVFRRFESVYIQRFLGVDAQTFERQLEHAESIAKRTVGEVVVRKLRNADLRICRVPSKGCLG